MDAHFKALLDYVVWPLLIATHFLFQWLPTIALLVPVIYYGISIYESKTFKQLRNRWREQRVARIRRRIARLAMKSSLLESDKS
jgi:hypothetical protein